MNRDELVEAYLDDYHRILVSIDKMFFGGVSDKFHLVLDDYIEELTVLEHNSDGLHDYYYLEVKSDLVIGKEYEVMVTNARRAPLQYRFVTKTEKFEKEFSYFKNDLGCTINDQVTNFSLWAPTASQVILMISQYGNQKAYNMARTDKGVYRISFNSNLSNCEYYYLVKVNGYINETLDPYGKLSLANSKANVVYDANLFKSEIVPVKKVNDPIIYETSVRDFSNEKTFLSFAMNCDYLKELGVSHVQLMPVNDFYSVNDYHKDLYYNWGYDPYQYQCFDASYSSDINDPVAVNEEFSLLVNKLHQKGIKVNLDVVFNHVYSVGLSSFEKSVPYYYFRYDNGRLSQATGCGNELDTEKSMVRKYVIDTLKYYVQVYDVDGFRFDLMGIIDVDTINMISQQLKEIKEDIMLYGEGWQLNTCLPLDKQASSNNCEVLKDVSFFNDTFRDVIKGSTFNKEAKGYATNDLSLVDKAMECIKAGLYKNSKQSINYVECHDNMTLFDKVRCCCDENYDDSIARIKLINGLVILSQGIPFIHAGQEHCQSKQMIDNTYNMPDEVNHINQSNRYKYQDVVEYVKTMIQIRKKYQLNQSKENVETKNVDGVIVYKVHNCLNQQTLTIIINPTTRACDYYFNNPEKLIFNGFENKQEIVCNCVTVDRLSITILGSDIND